MWGFCPQSGPCSPIHLGYSWGSEIISGLTYALILIPIGPSIPLLLRTRELTGSAACGLSFLSMLSLLPIVWGHGLRMYPTPAFSLFALLAAVATLAAFVFQIALFASAYTRFAGHAQWGALPWLVLVAAVCTLVASVHSGCGTMFRGGRSAYVSYADAPRRQQTRVYRY
jgi:hypothetical protein